MPETRINQKCPNCGAWLPFRQTLPGRRKCDFCGVAVPQLPMALPQTSGAAPALLLSLGAIALLAVVLGAVLAGWQRPRAPARKVLAPPAAKVLAPPVPPAAPPAPSLDPPSLPLLPPAPPPEPPRRSRPHRAAAAAPHAEPCHVSGVEMDQMRDRHGDEVKSCFAAALKLLPTDVGLSSTWDLVIDGDGKVVRVSPHLHVLDYKRSDAQRAAAAYSAPARDSEAVRCAVRALEHWDFGDYLTDLKAAKDRLPPLEMTCGLTLGLARP